MKKPIKRPRDPVQLAKLIGDIATKKVKDEVDDGKRAAHVEIGKLGGLKGGKARAEKLTSEQRSEIARKAALKRWHK